MSNEWKENDPESDATLLEDIIMRVVDHPDDVHVNEQGDTVVLFTIHVHPSDRGKVIGKAGGLINALRRVFGSIKGNERKKAVIEVAGADKLLGEKS